MAPLPKRGPLDAIFSAAIAMGDRRNRRKYLVSAPSTPVLEKKRRLSELWLAYRDLDQTLVALRARARLPHALAPINVRKLIRQLARSKRQLERKIGNTLLIEKDHLKRRIQNLSHHWKRTEPTGITSKSDERI